MKKFILNLPDGVHEKLKEYAAKDERSMQNYMKLWLTYIASEDYRPAPIPSTSFEMMKLYYGKEDR